MGVGGLEDDLIHTGKGNDIYIYTKGDGNDTLYNESGSDFLVLRGFSKDEILFTKGWSDLTINFKNQSGSIVIENQFGKLYGMGH